MTFIECQIEILMIGVSDGMEKNQLMLKGYIEGYKDGFRDATNGKANACEHNDFLELPIKVMPLSARARNCLTAAGCVNVRDVISLEEMKIARIRNLGIKTAKEIGLWLVENGVYASAWSNYI